MAKKPKRMWVYSPKKPTPPQVPDQIKAEVESRANELVETYLKPTYIKPPPRDQRWNYIIDLFTKWHRSFFYFCSTYACPGPNALSPTFESRFARMEYVGNAKFALSFMRHTGQWVELYDALAVDECLKAIQDDPWFVP